MSRCAIHASEIGGGGQHYGRDAALRTLCTFTVNGNEVCVGIAPGDRLVDVLRDALGLTGVKEGCGNGECGACTVLVDERPVNACLYPGLDVEGRCVTTVEGLTPGGGEVSDLQRNFVDHGAIQCGFCTPGMVVSAHALLARDADPDEGAIRDALVGNLCRCTGYAQIVQAVQATARERRHE